LTLVVVLPSFLQYQKQEKDAAGEKMASPDNDELHDKVRDLEVEKEELQNQVANMKAMVLNSQSLAAVKRRSKGQSQGCVLGKPLCGSRVLCLLYGSGSEGVGGEGITQE
jgi:hypothetical protein